ncbi:MAG: hypothetical protein HY756_05365 [Nitrospirae bacterium]|nr:hypothetical protein [Nitrospirota bacterium]
MKKFILSIFCVLCSMLCVLGLSSCASVGEQKKAVQNTPASSNTDVTKNEQQEKASTPQADSSQARKIEAPEFVPVREDVSPLQTKIISVSARNTPLRDVLHTIAEAASLNIVMERGVDPETPITTTLNNIPIEEALNNIFDSVDYFYSIKGNILTVKAFDTKIFEIGQSNIIQDYQTDIGGDILGGTSSGEGAASIKGNIAMKSTSDKASFQFWDAVENSLKSLIQQPPTEVKGAQKTGYTINRMAGTVMITATKRDIEKVSRYFATLKKILNRQVFIEARIVEVQLSEGLKYGIDWTFLSTNNWKAVGNITLNTGTKNFTTVVDSTGPNFQFGITGQDFTSLLLALQLNGQTALLSVGRNTSFISKVETTTTTGTTPTVSFTIETKSVLSGIIFGLAPFINEDGEITLTITPIVTNLINLEEKTIGTGGTTVEIKLPTVDLREMSTIVKIRDGQMVVIGGLIDKKEKLKENRIPLLGDIPGLGYLFKTVDKSYEKTELVIMLTPRIVTSDK